MARILGLFPEALMAARAGMNASQFYQDLRARGIAPRQSEAAALFAQAKAIVADHGSEPFRDLRSVPTADELRPWPTRTGTGVSQRVLLTYRDKATGAQATAYYTVSSDNGVTRQEAINSAIDAYRSNEERYNQQLIGAVHLAAYQLTPFQGA